MLFQLIHKPTRGIIFWIWLLLGTLILEPFSSSDHSKTLVELRIPAPRIDHAPRKVYSYSKGKYDQFNLAVSQIKWYDLLCDKTVDQKWITFKELYEELLKNIFQSSLFSEGQRSKPPWKRYKSVLKA